MISERQANAIYSVLILESTVGPPEDGRARFVELLSNKRAPQSWSISVSQGETLSIHSWDNNCPFNIIVDHPNQHLMNRINSEISRILKR